MIRIEIGLDCERTFHVVGQKRDSVHICSQLAADLLVRCLLKLWPSVYGVVVRREQRLYVFGSRAILDVREELQLRLHTTGGEDGEGAPRSFP